ncbi:MAG: DUF3261 domain-containing protein [Desulfobacteraceae bacterium]|nr:DUF3261 domain-containing protein [Desulfobacteraceae bacterium]
MIFFKKTLFFLLILLLCSCASKQIKKEFISENANIFLQKIIDINSSKGPSNGTGQITVENNGRVHKFKIAFASDSRKKIRLEILSPAGLPALSLSYDGSKLYLRQNNGSKPKSFSNYKKILKKITGVSPDSEIIASLLCRKIPLIEYSNAILNSDSSSETLFLSSENKKQSINIHKSNGILSEISTEEDKFLINLENNGNFLLVSEKTGNKLLFSSSSFSPLKNEPHKNIFILTR